MTFLWPIIFIVLAIYAANALFGKTIATMLLIVLVSFPALWSLSRLRSDYQAGAITKETLPTWAVKNFILILSPVTFALLLLNEFFLRSPMVFAGSALVYGITFVATYKSAISDFMHGGMLGDKVLRGSRVVDGATLQRDLLKGIEASREPVKMEPMVIAGLPIPPELEMQHFLIGGTNGAGKTQAIEAMLRTARNRGNKAIVSDTGCGFLGRFWKENDIILNPFDSRGAAWSPFAEIKRAYDCPRLAKAVIPEGKGDGAEWHHYAQTLLGEVLLSMWEGQDASIEKLMYYLTAATSKELSALLQGTPAAILCEKGNEKMLSNTRGIISTYMGTWRYLQDGGTFSIRDWVRDESAGWLYLTMRESQVAELKSMVTTWLELAIVEGLDLPESRERRLFYVLDELDTLGRMEALRHGATKLRKRGGVIISGLQTVAQLWDTWGKDAATVLLGNFNTKVIFRAGDAETGKAFEREIGEQEVQQTMQNVNISNGEGDGSTSYNTQRKVQATVLASDLQHLPNLQGFIKIPGYDIAPFALEYHKMEEVKEGFIEREIRSKRKQEAEPALAIARG